MITLIEKSCIKVPGLTSIFLYSEYKKELVSYLHTLNCAYYHIIDKSWEIPLTELGRLTPALVTYDDIELKVLEEEKVVDKTFSLTDFKTKPYNYQLEGIQFGLNHKKWLLLDEMGLGKSLQCIYLAEELYFRGEIEHCLIVCGINSLKFNWRKEIKKHSKLNCAILGQKINKKGILKIGDINDRIQHILNPIEEFFIITNVETLRDTRVVDAINNSPNKIGLIGLDEAHKVKSESAQQSQGLLKLDAERKVAITGTPILNTPLDAYVLLKWIGVEHSDFFAFKKQYAVTAPADDKIIIGYKNLDYLKECVSNCSIRRKKKEVLPDLPEQMVEVVDIEFGEKQAKFYKEVKEGIKNQVDKVRLIPKSIRAMTTRLRQATVLPDILSSHDIPSAKIDWTCERVEEIVSSGNKVVIFSTYKEPVYKLQKLLSEYKPLIATGDQSDSEIATVNEMFQNDIEHKVVVGTWSKVGTGLDWNKAPYLIFLDTPYTQGAFDQCCARISRIGTTSKTMVYVLVSRFPDQEDENKKTIDEVVQDILLKKSLISNYVVDDELPDEYLEDMRKYILDLF